MDWELLSFIKRSVQRTRILEAIDQPITPSELAKKTNLAPSHISRTIKEFSEKGLLECKTPNHNHGRIYFLTDKGKEITEIIKGGELADEYSK
ncbi:MarR family transcriptional regulator [Candidatus Woesearchaeota archaeon]|nr:MarR family transcriptional regulator [Candidatus Woesearchaeota archaeon]